MKSNKNKLRKILTTSLVVGVLAGSDVNAGVFDNIGKAGGFVYLAKFLWDYMGKDIYEKFKSIPIEKCKISDIGFDNIYVFNGQIVAATVSNNLCFLDHLATAKNMLISSSANGPKMYYGNKEQFDADVEEINQAYLNGEITGDIIAFNYFSSENGNNGSLARTINYYIDTKEPASKIKLQITIDTLFRVENANFSFKVKNADIIQKLNNNMTSIVDGSVSRSKLSNLSCNDIEIIETPREKAYNLAGKTMDKNGNDARINDLKQLVVNDLNQNILDLCKVPNEDLVLIKSDNSAPVNGQKVNYPTSDEINNKNKNKDNNYLPTPKHS